MSTHVRSSIYLLFLKKQQNSKLSSAALYGFNIGYTTVAHRMAEKGVEAVLSAMWLRFNLANKVDQFRSLLTA